MTREGGCLCGRVRYAIGADPVVAVHCHCSKCRKAHGTTHATFAVVRAREFRWLGGEDALAVYESSPGNLRRFCAQCGTQLTIVEPWNPRGITLALGTLDGDPGVRVSGHIFVGSKPAWCAISDDLPQEQGWPPGLGPGAAAPS